MIKKLILLIQVCLLCFVSSYAQPLPIKLSSCIQSALQNKNEILALKADRLLVGLETKAIVAKYFPQLSADYVYRYNPIISSQIVPVGQFLPVATDETKAIQFGTHWQQNAGLNLYQPILDASIRSSMNESKINESLKDVDELKANQALTYEVMKTFVSIYLSGMQLESTASDTLRSYKTFINVQSKFEEGKVLKTELNQSLINHHANLSVFKQQMTDLLKQQIYLSFLTGIPLLDLKVKGFDFSICRENSIFDANDQPVFDELPTIKQYHWQERLIETKILNEHRKYIPTLGLQGFLGANQYADQFDPFKSKSWYGSSYVGIQFKLPILFGEHTQNRIKQLHQQAESLSYKQTEEEQRVAKELAQMIADIDNSKDQLQLLNQDITLLTENVTLLQYRFDQGQATGYDLNDEEMLLQKKRSEFDKQSISLLLKKLDKLQISGQLPAYTNMILQNGQ